MSESPLLAMRGVKKRFGAVHALVGVDFEVARGEVHALLGENGAGKSTLMKVLSGAIRPDSGEVTLAGARFEPSNPLDAERRGVSMIYQERSLAADMSVQANILLGHEPSSFGVVDRARAREVSLRALDRLGHPELVDVSRASKLGPGECQVVEIARALSRSAKLIVMDEPTSSLSGVDVERLFEIVARLKSDGVTVIYISHFLEEVARVADRYTVLRDGCTVAAGLVATVSRKTLLEQMAGRELSETSEGSSSSPGEEVLELDGVGVSPSGRTVSLSLRRGEILGLAGLLGAGRTELVRAIFGLAPVRSGRIRVAAIWDRGRSPWDRLSQGVGMLSEDRAAEGVALSMTVSDNLTLSHLAETSRFGVVDRDGQRARAERWIQALGIRCRSPDVTVSSLSGGNQQKVALARLLDCDVDVFLLDEPTRGVDAATKEGIYRLLRDLAARGKSILFVSSYVPELIAACDRITVMYRGELFAPRATAEWTEAAIVDLATRGAET